MMRPKRRVQRLLLSQGLPAAKVQESLRAAQVLDPLRLFHHLQDLQQGALWLGGRRLTRRERDLFRGGPAVLHRAVYRRASSCRPRERGDSMAAGAGDPESQSLIPSRRINLSKRQTTAPHPLARVLAPPPVLPSPHTVEACSFPAQPTTEDEATRRPTTTDGVAVPSIAVPSGGPSQASHVPASHTRSHLKSSEMTIEQAIQDYLEDQRSRHRRPKTLEWHETALGLFQHYLLIEHQCLLPRQITEAQVRAWLAFLPQTKSATGYPRSSSTVESYARSARAFCQWVVRHRYLPATPFAHLPLPQVETCLRPPLEPEEWETAALGLSPSKGNRGAGRAGDSAQSCHALGAL